MLRTWKTAIAFPAALSVVAVACGGGGGDTDDTTREISGEELAQMVLDLGQFGPEYAGFAPDEVSGSLSFDQTADEEDDPAAEKVDLQQFGWVAAHKAFFESPQAVDGQAFGLGSMVYLFGTPDGASGYQADSRVEIEEDWNEEGVDTFELSDLDLADEAVRVQIGGPLNREDGSVFAFSATVVAFRRGRLVNVVSMYSINASDAEKQRLQGNVEALASAMNDRIAGLLAAGVGTAEPAAAGQ